MQTNLNTEKFPRRSPTCERCDENPAQAGEHYCRSCLIDIGSEIDEVTLARAIVENDIHRDEIRSKYS